MRQAIAALRCDRWLAPALLGLACAAPAPAPAQGGQWQPLYDQALRAHAAQAYEPAEAAAREALALARRAQATQAAREPYVASSLNLLAMIAQDQGRHEAAATLLAEALALAEASIGMHANTAAIAWNLGNALAAQGRVSEALPHYRRALEIAQARPDDAGMAALRAQLLEAMARLESRDALAQAAHLNERGLQHAERQEYVQAAQLFARAQRITEAHAPDDPALARLLASRARMALALRQDEEARDWFAQALERYRGEAGTEALIGQADARNGLASLLYLKRRFKEAEPEFAQALQHMEQAVGPDDPRLLPLLDNLAALHRSLGRAGEPPQARRATAIRAAQAQ